MRPRVSSTDMKSRLPYTDTSPWPPGQTIDAISFGDGESLMSYALKPLKLPAMARSWLKARSEFANLRKPADEAGRGCPDAGVERRAARMRASRRRAESRAAWSRPRARSDRRSLPALAGWRRAPCSGWRRRRPEGRPSVRRAGPNPHAPARARESRGSRAPPPGRIWRREAIARVSVAERQSLRMSSIETS